MADTKDRIQIAWETRRDIHAWIKAHPRSTMENLFDAFPNISNETIRKNMTRMRKDTGDIAMVAKIGSTGYYIAVSQQIKPLHCIRRKMAATGRKAADKRYAADRARKKKEQAIEAAKAKAVAKAARQLAQRKPGRQNVSAGGVHSCGDTPQGPGSHGQGSVRQRVNVNCYQNY